MPRRHVEGGGTKPTFLPEACSTDPVAHFIAGNHFWSEQLMERAMFFVMPVPGPERAGRRTRLERSIIHPALADHVRSEALNAADELRRAA